MVQSKFMSRVRGPHHVRESIEAALADGESFTAKIGWLSYTPSSEADRPSRKASVHNSTADGYGIVRDGSPAPSVSSDGSGGNQNGDEQKARWIHCTPLFGKEKGVGVWMVVFI